jgi:hypothetical protein
MEPDDPVDPDGPTKPLPVEPGPTEPMIAPHVPIADVSTAQLDPVAPAGRPHRSPGSWWLVAAVAVLGVVLIVVLTMLWGNAPTPTPTVTPTPESTPTFTVPPTEGPPVDVPETPEDAPDEPAPEPTTPPEPTDPPDPDPTETPVAAAL